MSSYKKRKKARKAREREKAREWEEREEARLRSMGFTEALYKLKIDLKTATYLMSVVIDRGSNEYITSMSSDWDERDWIYMLIQAKDQLEGFDDLLRYVLENDEIKSKPGTLFPKGVE